MRLATFLRQRAIKWWGKRKPYTYLLYSFIMIFFGSLHILYYNYYIFVRDCFFHLLFVLCFLWLLCGYQRIPIYLFSLSFFLVAFITLFLFGLFWLSVNGLYWHRVTVVFFLSLSLCFNLLFIHAYCQIERTFVRHDPPFKYILLFSVFVPFLPPYPRVFVVANDERIQTVY